MAESDSIEGALQDLDGGGKACGTFGAFGSRQTGFSMGQAREQMEKQLVHEAYKAGGWRLARLLGEGPFVAAAVQDKVEPAVSVVLEARSVLAEMQRFATVTHPTQRCGRTNLDGFRRAKQHHARCPSRNSGRSRCHPGWGLGQLGKRARPDPDAWELPASGK